MRKLLVVATGLLAACSGGDSGGDGGGGGGGPEPDFSNPRTVQPGEPFPSVSFFSAGKAVRAQADQNALIGEFSQTTAQIFGSNDTDGDGEADLVRFETNAGSVVMDFRNPTEAQLIDERLVRLIDDDGSSVLVTATDFMEFATFGGWSQRQSDGTIPPGGNVNFAAFGAPTPERDLPSGQFVYTGQSVGTARNRGNTAATTSDVRIDITTFPTITGGASSQVLFSSINTQTEIIEGAQVGTVSDSPNLDFATIRQPVSGTTFSLFGLDMEVDGAFYGDEGQEAAGTFNGEIDGIEYGGAFGAVRTR